MAAGIVKLTVTTTTGETIEQAFWVDDTVTPTMYLPLSRPSDGTSVAAVKAASTAPVKADPALVVAISPNVPDFITRAHVISAASGAQTNLELIGATAGNEIVVTELVVKNGASVTVPVTCTIGFHATATPTPTLAGTANILIDAEIAANFNGEHRGDGSGILGASGDSNSLFLTCSEPTGGALYVEYTYFVRAV